MVKGKEVCGDEHTDFVQEYFFLVEVFAYQIFHSILLLTELIIVVGTNIGYS